MRRVHLGSAVAIEVEQRVLVPLAPVEVAAGDRPARRRRSAPGRRSGRWGRRSSTAPTSRRPPRRHPWRRRPPTCRSGTRRSASRARCGIPAGCPGSDRARSGSACCSRRGSSRRPAAPSRDSSPASAGRCRSSSPSGRRTLATRRTRRATARSSSARRAGTGGRVRCARARGCASSCTWRRSSRHARRASARSTGDPSSSQQRVPEAEADAEPAGLVEQRLRRRRSASTARTSGRPR